jgi:hypothetical protein
VETYEEWRLIFEVGKAKDVDRAVDDSAERVPDDVDIHRRGDQILIYAFTEEAARAAGDVLSERLVNVGVNPVWTMTRWNPGGECWQDPALPVESRETDIGPEWAALGELAWEVRVRSQIGSEARRLAEDLISEGYPMITGLRNRVTVGVADETEASLLANDLRLQAPTATIAVRPLSRWRRWLIRQRLLGNYAATGGGVDGGNGGGGNGGGAA